MACCKDWASHEATYWTVSRIKLNHHGKENSLILSPKKAVLWQMLLSDSNDDSSWQPGGYSKQTNNTLYGADWDFSHCHHNTLHCSTATCLCHDLTRVLAAILIPFLFLLTSFQVWSCFTFRYWFVVFFLVSCFSNVIIYWCILIALW